MSAKVPWRSRMSSAPVVSMASRSKASPHAHHVAVDAERTGDLLAEDARITDLDLLAGLRVFPEQLEGRLRVRVVVRLEPDVGDP